MSSSLVCVLLSVGSLVSGQSAPIPAQAPFLDRGYYITFMRMPTYDLADWKAIVDGVHDDGGNLILLWMAGAFRSARWPVTWRYNQEHENVRKDFVRSLIDHAHRRNVRVLLGFTPFGYDGVNQYAIEHPELKAVGQDGRPVKEFGIGCWGYNLCPSQPESRRFMLDYVRELFFDFYPNADGLLIESSDYAICHGPGCAEQYFDREFEFVKELSNEVWTRRSDAMIVVYPHYFTGAQVPGFNVRASRQSFDPRWSVFFTPHSAHLDASLIKKAQRSLWWDDAPSLRGPHEVQAGAKLARDAGVTSYVPSLEGFSFLATHNEEGQPWTNGKRQVPWGFGWLAPGVSPYNELPLRVQRIAYREFSHQPDLPFETFREILGRDLFGSGDQGQAVDDLLELQSIFAMERSWTQPSPIVSPDRVRAMKLAGSLDEGKRQEYRSALNRVQTIADRHVRGMSASEQELHRIARWILNLWQGRNLDLLQPQPSR